MLREIFWTPKNIRHILANILMILSEKKIIQEQNCYQSIFTRKYDFFAGQIMNNAKLISATQILRTQYFWTRGKALFALGKTTYPQKKNNVQKQNFQFKLLSNSTPANNVYNDFCLYQFNTNKIEILLGQFCKSNKKWEKSFN